MSNPPAIGFDDEAGLRNLRALVAEAQCAAEAGDRSGSGKVVRILNEISLAVAVMDLEHRSGELRRLRVAIEESPVALLVTDANGKIEQVNAAFEKYCGFSADELIGNKPQILKSGHQDPEVYQALWATITSGEVWRGILCNRRKDGTLYWVSSVIAPVQDADGKIVSFVSAQQDITKQRIAENHVRDLEARYRSLADDSPLAIAVTDLETSDVLYANRQLGVLMNAPPEQLIGRPAAGFYVNPADRADMVAKLMASGDVIDFETRLRTVPGRAFWASFSSTLTQFNGRRAVQTVILDVSRRKESEEALQRATRSADAASRAKSEFLAMMSHELRTPMNGVIGYCSLLETTPLSPEQSEFVAAISASGDEMVKMINTLLDFSKIEAGRVELQSAPMDLVPAITDVCRILRPLAASKGLSLDVQFAPEVPDLITGDELRLKQIVTNLVTNAIKFTDSGRVDVCVSAEAVAGIHRIRIDVRDTGIGISPESIPKLFVPFTQLESAGGRRFGGSGLGLSICKSLSELMGGTILVESTLGQGSTFSVIIEARQGSERIPNRRRQSDDRTHGPEGVSAGAP